MNNTAAETTACKITLMLHKISSFIERHSRENGNPEAKILDSGSSPE